MINLVRRRYWFFGISLLLIIPGLIALLVWNLRLSIDFQGGTLWEYTLTNIPYKSVPAGTDQQVNAIFARNGHEDSATQLAEDPASKATVALVRTKFTDPNATERATIGQELTSQFGAVSAGSFSSVGPSVSSDSTRAAIIAVLGAAVAILGYLTFAFRKAPHPFRYGVCAIVAMLHDVLLVLGVAAILGQLIGLEVDALFLTALLTVISFSVHDTIVVFDRVRENVHRMRGVPFEEVVNHSLLQTLTRSINTQLTVLLTLLALLFFVKATLQLEHFILILTIGLISGTYSSIFNAAQLLVVWENGELGLGNKSAAA
jgi:preprotein translocase subunit SecF